ncbi:MAG: hypothetical protein M1816_000271 [Peltula sp. TS41687]|nr:MAG: hypothetical protein M1816_000271 [Peltula sp. TS41687]
MTLQESNKKKKNGPPGLLSHGRPPTSVNKAPPLSSKATRTLIRRHHQLVKQRSLALSKGDAQLADSITAQIEAQGGLKRYQQASLQGQSGQRGGDTSKILMEWLQPIIVQTSPPSTKNKNRNMKLKMLEIGCLSPQNACSQSGLFQVTRIDLHPQDGSTIQKQDFMLRPLPPPKPSPQPPAAIANNNNDDDDGRFDIISLSLVLNYVSDPSQRGEMLSRTTQFLRSSALPREMAAAVGSAVNDEFFPSLFLVLPAPCVNNSRYLDDDRLEEIMSSMGYVCVRRKKTNKLAYWLWRFDEKKVRRSGEFAKKEVRSGAGRNNFAVVVKR